jgi:hypothetical protein
MTMGDDSGTGRFDRDHVLFGPLRDAVLDVEQVRRYGADTFGDPDAISLYGMTPHEWFARGIRMLGRTTVECTRDSLAWVIASDVAGLAQSAPEPVSIVVDPFAGSANTLYWMHAALPRAMAVGVEFDPVICEHTRHNLELVGCPITMRNDDFAHALGDLDVPSEGLAVVFIGPPWGHAFDPDRGLDLAGTTPPVRDIVTRVEDTLGGRPLLIAVQAFERMEPESLADVRSMLDWSHVSTYSLNPPGRNPATLLGTRGWVPDPAAPLG